MPYYVLYKIPFSLLYSKLCTKGNIYFAKSNFEFKDIKKINFKKSRNNCINIDNNSKYLYILGYSINNNDNLEIKLNGNIYSFFLDFSKIILHLSFLLFI